ncbi:MAG: L-threonylcarbamoyladenylate synthase [Chitinophagales bacterium]
MKNTPDKPTHQQVSKERNRPTWDENPMKILQNGGTILYPTDTVWGIGCDATSEEAVKKVYALKQRDESKALIILVKDEEMLRKYVTEIPSSIAVILTHATRPTTIIYPNARNLASNLIAEDGSIAIRIPQHDFCQNLLQQWQKPLVSTSANISGEPTPIHFSEISETIKNQVDYVVDSDVFDIQTPTQPSRILKIGEEGEVLVIRE